MREKSLEYYMDLEYTIEITRSNGTCFGHIRELPGCFVGVDEDEPVEELWRLLDKAKRQWIRSALREGRWVPEPPQVDAGAWEGFSEDEDVREVLYKSGIRRFPLSLLQQLWLKELSNSGLQKIDSSLQTPAKAASRHDPRSKSLTGDVCPVQIGNSEKTIWLRFDGERTEPGYRAIEVMDEPMPQEIAIIAALTVLEATKLNGQKDEHLKKMQKSAREALDEFGANAANGSEFSLYTALDQLSLMWNRKSDSSSFSPAQERFLQLPHEQIRTLQYSLALIRHRRAGFDQLPYREQVDLFIKLCAYVDNVVVASNKLAAFVEYGNRTGLPKRTVKRIRDQIRVTVLADVEGLKHEEIADTLNIDIPSQYKINMEIPEIKDLVRDGRDLLQRAVGKEGWRKQAGEMKLEIDRWCSLNPEEKETELLAERAGMSVEEVRDLKESNSGWLEWLRAYYL